MSAVQKLLAQHKHHPANAEPPTPKDTTTEAAPVVALLPRGNSEGTEKPSPGTDSDLAALFDQADKQGGQKAAQNTERVRAQQSRQIQQTLAALDLVMDERGNIFLISKHGGRVTALPIESNSAYEDIALRIKEVTGNAVGKDIIQRELAPIKAAVRRKGVVYKTSIRCAKDADGYLLDLGTNDGRVARITADGWCIESQPSGMLFLRSPAMGEHPIPAQFDTVACAVDFLLTWVRRRGVSEQDAVVCVAALVEALRPDTPYPIIVLIGEAGSGKTEFARCLALLIDPSRSGALADIEPTVEAFAAASHVRYLFSVDNKQRLSAPVQDLFCKVATGAEHAARLLYSQNELASAYLHNPTIVTAVTYPFSAPDAASRTLSIPIKRPASYRSTESLREEFEAERPALLGALLCALSGGLRMLPNVAEQRQWTHRLVSYAQIGEATLQAAGKESGYFLERLEAQQRRAARESAGGDTFVTELRGVLRKVSGEAVSASTLPPASRWCDSSGAGYAAVKRPEDGVFLLAFKASVLFRKLHMKPYMPETERQLGDYITRAAPILRAIGIESERKEARGKRTVWVFAFKEGAIDD